jgi:hypothetical protein
MHKKLSIILLGFMLLLLQGCATNEKFVMKYNSWVGQPIDNLVKQVGYPDSTYILANKNKVYVYERSRVYTTPVVMPVYAYGYGGYYGGYGMIGYPYAADVVQKTCKLFLETNKKGIIVRWGSRGNDCVSN